LILLALTSTLPSLAQPQKSHAVPEVSPAETAAPQAAENPTPLRVTTRLVQVNVIVNDKHGHPIKGLAQSDFQLFDDKKPQDLKFFSVETNLPSESVTPPLPLNTYNNRWKDLSSVPANITVILLDALNTELADQAFARQHVLKFLQQIQPQDRVALYWLNGGLFILHDFTNDSAALREALASLQGESSRTLANSAPADPSVHNPNSSVPAGQSYEREAFRRAFDQRAANHSAAERVRFTVAALVAIANHIGSIKGRKNLVWVSGSFPFSLGYDRFDLDWTNDTGAHFGHEVERAARALTDANIAVYPVDARGLIGMDTFAAQGDSESGTSDPTNTEFHLPTKAANENLDTMKILAERTGGKAFYSTNDLSGSIRHAIDDSRLTYTLGYYPQQNWNGSFHPIKVKVNLPGAEVRARSGYFALPEIPVSPAKNNRAVITQAATSPLEATGIGLQVELLPSVPPSANTLTFKVHVNPHNLQIEESADRWVGTLQSVFLQINPRGEIISVGDQIFHLDWDRATYEQALNGELTDTRPVQILPNASKLCVVVRDLSNGNIGSIFLPLSGFLPDQPN
jgi:VWFA-related protein